MRISLRRVVATVLALAVIYGLVFLGFCFPG